MPNAITPYVGAGAGALWYEFHQTRRLRRLPGSVGVQRDVPVERLGPERTRVRGVDVKIARRLFLTGEGRYLWSQAELGPDFSSFEPIDLTGFKLTAGINYLF